MGSFLNGKNIEDETIEESKINGGFPGGDGGGITDINNLMTLFQNTILPNMSEYWTLSTYVNSAIDTAYTLKSPDLSNVPPSFNAYDSTEVKGNIPIRAYFKRLSYPDKATIYKTQYKTETITVDYGGLI